MLIAAPLVLIFGALFMAADAVFQGIVERTLNIQPDVVISHIFFIGFFSLIVAGYLRGALIEGFALADGGAAAASAEVSVVPKDEIKPQVPSVTEIGDEEIHRTDEKPQAEEKRTWSWQNLDSSFLPKVFTLGAIDETIVRLAPDGAVAGFARRLPERYVHDPAHKALDAEAARSLAEARARDFGVDVQTRQSEDLGEEVVTFSSLVGASDQTSSMRFWQHSFSFVIGVINPGT